MNTILLFVEAFYISITRALLNDSLLFLPIFLVIMGLIWVLPNIVYFRHRRYLFGIEPLESAHSSESTEAVRFQPGLSASETNISEDSSALLISSPIMEFDHDTSPKAPHDDPHLNIAVFCHKCGAKLLDGASFCRKCGTPTHHFSSINQEVTSDPSRILPHGEIAKEKVPYVENDLNNDGDTIPDHDWRIDLLDKTLPPKIRRASLYIEDGEWDNAEKTLEAVLDEDPTNAYAYIGKTLVDFRVSQTSDLVNFADTLAENKNFQKAVRFADETIAKKLLSLPLSAKIQS